MHLMVIEGTCAAVIRGTARQITSMGQDRARSAGNGLMGTRRGAG